MWEGGTPFPHPHPLGASFLALAMIRPPLFKSWIRPCIWSSESHFHLNNHGALQMCHLFTYLLVIFLLKNVQAVLAHLGAVWNYTALCSLIGQFTENVSVRTELQPIRRMVRWADVLYTKWNLHYICITSRCNFSRTADAHLPIVQRWEVKLV